MAVAEKSPAVTGASELTTIKMADSEKKSVTTALPKPVLDALKAEATQRDLTDNSIVREIVAAHYGFKIVDNKVPRVGKYVGLTKEEANAKRNAENQKNRARMAKILAAIENGDIPADLLAKLDIDVQAA
jgi:hypothetical protein